MKKNFALIYKYFCFKNLPQPYFRSVMTLIGFSIMFLSLLFAIFPLPLNFNPFGISKETINNYVYGGIYVAVLYFIIAFVFKKKYLEKYSFTDKELKACGRYIVVLFLILFFVLFSVIILQVRNRW